MVYFTAKTKMPLEMSLPHQEHSTCCSSSYTLRRRDVIALTSWLSPTLRYLGSVGGTFLILESLRLKKGQGSLLAVVIERLLRRDFVVTSVHEEVEHG